MVIGKKDSVTAEDFTVTDSSNNLVTGITLTEFTYKLYNDAGADVSGSVTVAFSELGNGNYRASFTLTTLGTFYLAVYHAVYFPWGKTGTIQVYTNDFDTVSSGVWDVARTGHTTAGTFGEAVDIVRQVETGRWKITTGNQMIFYAADGVTPILTFDLKDSAGTPTVTNPFERDPV